MRNIPREMIIDSVDAGVGAVIDLFELDLTPLGGEVIRFHSGVNGYYGPVIWKGWLTTATLSRPLASK